jgi:hypothetical protein
MNVRIFAYLIAFLIVVTGIIGLLVSSATADTPHPSPDPASGQAYQAPIPQALPDLLADSPISPTTPVKLIFIHHSTGGNWLADIGQQDQAGGLAQALMDNNYFVSATNYQWGLRSDPGDPDSAIGSRTDIVNWPEWFTGPNRDTIMGAVYTETGQNIGGFGDWSRMADPNPGGENEIIMFKSCFPNSDLYGNPGDDPLPAPNDYDYTVANAKAVYNDILTYFETRQDKLFIVITAPPMTEGEYTVNDPGTPAADRAGNARAFNNWLVNDWLASNSYTYTNVAVFDYYNVLTSNGSPTRIDDTSVITEPNDYDLRPDGNHHYWNGSQVTHTHSVSNDFSAYPSYSGGVDDYYDSHPMGAGQEKATQEFVPLLNVFYNRWKSGAAPASPELVLTVPTESTRWPVSSTRQIAWTTTGSVPHVNLFYSADSFVTSQTITLSLVNTGSYAWTTPPTPTTSARVRVESVVSPTAVFDVSDAFTLYQPGPMDKFVYLPLVLRSYAAAPTCAVGLNGVTIGGPTSGYTDTTYAFTANPVPINATTPINYTWAPEPDSGQGTTGASYQWETTGSKSITVTASNCGGTVHGTHTITIQSQPSGELIQPGDIVYQGAFRLPGADDTFPHTFAYGGNGMTFNPDGHTTNTDVYSGSLFITGYDRTDAYPNGSQIAELTIPVPVKSSNLDDLAYAGFIQGFHDVAAGYFHELDEIPKIGIQYLNHQDTGPKIHLTWGRHLQQLEDYIPSQAWINADLANPDLQGVWFIGNQNPNGVNGYLFDIPAAWADAHTESRPLATGRVHPGGLGGMGPALFAYRPWLTGGAAPVSGTHLSETVLLRYASAFDTEIITRCMTNYQHADGWEGGAWLTTPSGKSAVLFAGTKGTGIKYWYGYIHPTNPLSPCVYVAAIGDFMPCRQADGSECPPSDLAYCCDEEDGEMECISGRGWWSTRFDAQLILYNPADLAQVAAGEMESWEPQPYATIDVDDRLYFNPPDWDEFELGWGDQRRHRLGAAAYDHINGYLYVLELFGDGAKPVVHVWHVE